MRYRETQPDLADASFLFGDGGVQTNRSGAGKSREGGEYIGPNTGRLCARDLG